MNRLFSVAFLLVLSLSSCSTQNLFQGKYPLAPQEVFKDQPGYQYLIRKDDKVSISVWDHDDLSVGSVYGIYNSNEVYGKWLMVDGRGEIAIPKMGRFHIEGLSLMQAEDSLTKALSRQVVHPVVKVKVLNREVTVMGEVKSPGNLLIEKEEIRLTEVLGKAGDFDFYANKKKVHLLRKVGEQTYCQQINLTRDWQNPRILPGDIVYVPSKRGKDFDKRITTMIPLTSTVTALIIIFTTLF
jgi:polysaccharide export outer membrane protein